MSEQKGAGGAQPPISIEKPTLYEVIVVRTIRTRLLVPAPNRGRAGEMALQGYSSGANQKLEDKQKIVSVRVFERPVKPLPKEEQLK